MDTLKERQESEGLIELYDSFGDLFNFFCTNTTIHGTVRLVCSSHNQLKTAFWSLLFLAAFGMLSWQFGLLFEEYWKYPVIMNISVPSKPKMFPSITLCDMNPHRSLFVKRYLEELDEFAQENIYSLYKLNITEKQAGGHSGPALRPSFNRLFHLDRSISLEKLDRDAINEVGFRLCNGTDGDCFYRTHSSGVTAIQDWYQFHFINIMALLPPQNEKFHEDHEGNFILSCCYNGEPCQEHNYNISRHPIYGSCYTFNNWEKNNWRAKRPGLTHGMLASRSLIGTPQSGLVWKALQLSEPTASLILLFSLPEISFFLKVEQNNHFPLLSTEAGVKVMIHGQNQKPFLDHQGISLRPGTETTIHVREDEVEHRGSPYSNCTEDNRDVADQRLSDSVHQACLHSCLQELMIQTCGCGYYFYPLPDGAQYCNYNQHPAWGHCFYKLYQKQKSHRPSCFSLCPKPCRGFLYQFSTGVAKWPSSKSEDLILSVLGKDSSRNWRNSSAKVHIFHQRLNYFSMKEEPVYLVPDLLFEMGRLWGQWFGSSVLSIVEILELLLDVTALTFVLGYRRFFGSRPRPQQDLARE
ncbi:amiloride-sensitive sodium channel subunit delta [Antechinus flavipes]|uniref:amiloride-sensitive sodium channel subunit delta n=1 Tax=Antechinus flavipes TaxID=38775 RepID=UPI0022363714|nr:amiloride-sensitive sodium channel subunit delta [Antechinus flavipes]